MAEIVSFLTGKWDLLFAVIAVFGLLGGIWALIRGIYHTSVRYVVKGLLIVCLIFLMPQLVNLIAEIDLSQWISQSINVNGTPVQITTVDGTIVNLLNSFNLVDTSSDPSLYQTVLQLSHAIIGFVLYLVGFILVFILSPIISEIVYAVTFLIFLSKERRKTKKHRFISFGVGFVCSAVIFSLFLAPFSSLLSVASDTVDAINENGSEETKNSLSSYKSYIDLLSSYNDSAYYSTMTMGSKDTSKALDTKVMGQVTSVTVNGVSTSIYGELASILSAVPDIISGISIGDNNQITIDFSALSTPAIVSEILTNVSSWNIVMSLIPALMEIGTAKANINLSDMGIDLSAVDWSGTFTDINTIYGLLYDTGLISDYVIPVVVNKESKNFTIDYSKKDAYKSTLKAMVKSDLFQELIPGVLSNYLKAYCTSNGIDYISYSEENYASLDWENDIDIIVEFFFDACRILNITELTQDTLSNLSTLLMDKLEDTASVSNIKSLLCGGSVSLEASGDLEATTFTLSKGLLDIDFLSSKVLNLGSLISNSIQKVPNLSTYISDDTLTAISKDFSSVSSLKGEIGTLLSAYPKIKTCLDSNFDITQESVRTDLISVLNEVTDSKLFADILPDILTSVLSSDSVKDALFGLDASSLDLRPTDSEGNNILIPQIKSLLNTLGDALDISDLFSSGSSDLFSNLTNAVIDKINKVLTSFINNKVINPAKVEDGSGNKVKNVNFNTLIDGLLSTDSIKSYGITIPEDLSSISWSSVVDSNGLTTSGEIASFCSALKVIASNPSIFSDTLTISDISSSFVSELFSAINQSELLVSSLPGLLTKYLAPTINSIGISVDFNSITDWEKEGAAIGKVIDRIQDLGDVSLDSIDWMSMSSKEVNSILTALASTQMLGAQYDSNGNYTGQNALLDKDGTYYDPIGQFMYSFISKAGLSSEMIGNSLSESDFTCLASKYASSTSAPQFKYSFKWADSINSITYTFTMTSSGGQVSSSEVTADLACDGEIAYLSTGEMDSTGVLLGEKGIMEALKDLPTDGNGSYDFGNLTDGDVLSSVLKSLNASSLFSPCIGNVINYAVGKLSSISLGSGTSIDFSLVNGLYINSLSDSEKSDEFDNIGKLVSYVNNSDFTNGLSSGLTGISDSTLVTLEDMLNCMSKMKILTTTKQGASNSFFIEMLATMLHQTTLDQMITGEGETTAKASMISYLLNVDTWSFDESISQNASSDTETLSLRDAAVTRDSSTLLASSDSEILRICRVLHYVSSNSIDVSSLTDPNALTASQIQTMFEYINDSECMHSAMAEFFSKVFGTSGMDIASYIPTESDGTKFRTLNFEVNLNYSVDTVSFWNDEIDQLISLYDNLQTALNGSTDFGNIQIGDNVNMYDILGPLDKMSFFDDSKQFILYKFLTSAGSGSTDVSSYIRGTVTCAEADSLSNSSDKAIANKAYLIKKLLFWDGHSDAELSAQCGLLDNFIQTIINLTDIDMSGTGVGSSLGTSLFNLMYSSFDTSSFTSGDATVNYTRCYLAQEMIANLLTEKFSTSSGFTTEISSFFANFFFLGQYENDYLYLNIIEARGLQGVVSMMDLGTGDYAFHTDGTSNASFYEKLKECFVLMGREDKVTKDTAYASDEVKSTMLNNTEDKANVSLTKYHKESDTSKALLNSKIAYTLFNYYADKTTLFTSSGTDYTIKGVIDKYNSELSIIHLLPGHANDGAIDLANNSFEVSYVSIKAAIQYISGTSN